MPGDHPLRVTLRATPPAVSTQLRVLDESVGARALERGPDGRLVEMGTNDTVKQAVTAGLELAVISGHAVMPELGAGRLAMLGLEGAPIRRSWYPVRLADAELLPGRAPSGASSWSGTAATCPGCRSR